MIEVYPQIPYLEPFELFNCFPETPGTLFLDNASTDLGIGRYSYLLWNPFLEFSATKEQYSWKENLTTIVEKGNALKQFEKKLKQFPIDKNPKLPPFQGGAVGFFAYDLNRSLERLPNLTRRVHSFPDLHFYFYAHGLSFDTIEKKCWLFRHSFCPYSLQELIKQIPKPVKKFIPENPKEIEIKSNFTKEDYLKALKKTKDYLRAGDIFQANISQQFQGFLPLSSRSLYARLRSASPAPYAAYMNFGERKIISSSPELFLARRENKIHTHPIKGTRKRGATLEEDQQLKEELWNSEKDRAELTMIIDLSRNDLGRICKYGTVEVSHLASGGMYLETHPTVYHLVSHVQGTLDTKNSLSEIIAATFPGGSITGAPKIRAMEIIEELEPTRRGAYTGALGWIGFDQEFELSIGIRIIQIEGNQFSFNVGGGIVIDSEPEEEYIETLVKAKGILLALGHKKMSVS